MQENNQSLKGKRILIFQQRAWGRRIGHFLAKKLYAEGARLGALTSLKKTHESVLRQTDVPYEFVMNVDEALGDPEKYLAGTRYPLRDICHELGVDSIWPIMSALRMYTRSYGDKYYYGFKQNVPDEIIVLYAMAIYKYIRRIFTEFKPELIIAPNFVGPHHMMINIYAKRHGIPMFALTDSKIHGITLFSHDYTDSTGAFYDRVDELNRGKAETKSRDRAKEYIKKFREKFIKPDYANRPQEKKTLWGTIRHELGPWYHSLKWILKPKQNPWPVIGISTEWRPPRIMLRDHYMHKLNTWDANHFPYEKLERIGKCAYLPLQYQPEASIDVTAAFFANQFEVARLAAMSLPDDYTLVVKDHPAMLGLRSRKHLEKFARTINVKLIDYRVPSEAVIQKSDIILSMNSTTIAEAAFLRKPAIQFGNSGTTLKLPNVWKHTDMTTLTKKIREVLAIKIDTSEYERRLENYVAAAFDAGFDVNYLGIWERGETSTLENLWACYKKEIERIMRNNAAAPASFK